MLSQTSTSHLRVLEYGVETEMEISLSPPRSMLAVEYASLGSSRAATVCGLLQELNPSCSAAFVEESPALLIDTNEYFFDSFTLIVATQV